jgi:anti-sigma-K factor RskA
LTNGEHIRDEELELYALGGLPDEEAAALKSHLAGCGECAMKLAQSRGSAALLSFAAEQEQPAGTIKAELMARVRANRERDEQYAWPLQTKEPAAEKPGDNVTPANAKTNAWWNWVMIPTAVALALVSLALSWQNRKVSQALEKQRQAMQALLHDREETEKLVGVFAASDTLTVKLAPAAGTIGAGVVKYNGRMGMVVYSAQLPAAPGGKSYQMWLVPASGAPISAGVMEKGGRAVGPVWIAEVPANTEAKAFAITVEAAGGAPQPRGPKVLVGAS